MKPRERYRIEIYDDLLHKWSYLFPFEGSRQYVYGAFTMYDSYYGNSKRTDSIRIVRISDGAVLESGGGRQVSIQ